MNYRFLFFYSFQHLRILKWQELRWRSSSSSCSCSLDETFNCLAASQWILMCCMDKWEKNTDFFHSVFEQCLEIYCIFMEFSSFCAVEFQFYNLCVQFDDYRRKNAIRNKNLNSLYMSVFCLELSFISVIYNCKEC